MNKRRTVVLGSTLTLALMVLASFMPSQSFATPGAWRLISPTEYTATPNAELHGIYLTNGGTSGKGSGSGWAVGAGGFIYYWDGFSWEQTASPTTCELDAVNFGGPLNPLTSITSSSGWAVGGCGGVAKSLYFNGVGWASYTVPSFGAGQLLSVYEVQSASSSSNYVQAFAVGKDGTGGGFWQWNGVPGLVTAWTETSTTAAQVNGVYMTQCTGSPCAAIDGIAVGNANAGSGTIYRWYGGSWNLLGSHPVSVNLNAVAMSSPTNGWAVGDQCKIIRTTNTVDWAGGFSPGSCGAANNLRSIVMLSSSEAWAVGDGDAAGETPAILHGKSLDSAPTWTRIDKSQIAASNGLDSVTFATSGGNVWAVGKSGLATFCLSNCGTQSDAIWSTTTSPNTLQLDSVFMVSDSDGWAVGTPDPFTDAPSILRWNGGSFSWTRAPSVLPIVNPISLLGVYLSSGSTGWAVGQTPTYGGAPVSMWYDGNTWTGKAVGTCTCVLNSVYMVSDSNSWAVGTGGVIMHSSARGDQPGGQFGPAPSSVAGATYKSVYFDPTSSGNSGWAVGQNGGNPLIVHTASGGGDSWGTILYPPLPGVTLNSVFFQDSTHGWAAGDGSTILYWNGISWTTVSILAIINPPITITGIAVTGGPPATDGWAVGYDSSGLPITIHYDGTSSTWTEVPLSPAITLGGASASLTSLSLRSSTNGLAVGTGVTGAFTDSLSLILHLDPPGGVSANTVTTTSTAPSTTTTAPATTSSTAASTSSTAATTSSPATSTTTSPATSATSSSSQVVTSVVTSGGQTQTFVTTIPAKTTSRTASSSATTPLTIPAIPGFPWESIIAGIIVGLTVLGVARRRRRSTKTT